MTSTATDSGSFANLAKTRTFQNGGLERWHNAVLIVAGAGMIGERLVMEAALSGARVIVCDFDTTSVANLGNQRGVPGTPKVESLVARCQPFAAGRVRGVNSDVRHLGVGEFATADVLIDCSDDPALEFPLTQVSNGIGVPKLRLAVDGSGEREMGRVACSHGGGGYACGVCSYCEEDILRNAPRMSCPGQARPTASTLAGGALASAIAGVGLLQAQRLVTGNDHELVFNRTIVLDLTGWQVLPVRTERSEQCVSGHVRWELTSLRRSADDTTPGELLAESRRQLDSNEIDLEPYGHALNTAAFCPCGKRLPAVGTRWAAAPLCETCEVSMQWVTETRRTRLTADDLAELGIEDTPWTELGLPPRGAMIVARTDGKPPLRLVLD